MTLHPQASGLDNVPRLPRFGGLRGLSRALSFGALGVALAGPALACLQQRAPSARLDLSMAPSSTAPSPRIQAGASTLQGSATLGEIPPPRVQGPTAPHPQGQGPDVHGPKRAQEDRSVPVTRTISPRVGPAPPPILEGDRPIHAFASPPMGSEGYLSLEQMRGRPVVMMFVSLRCPACTGMAVPEGLRLLENHPDRMHLLVVEPKGCERRLESEALRQGWLAQDAMWTCEEPFPTGSPYMPVAYVLDAQGEVVFRGNPIRNQDRLRESVDREIAAAVQPPQGTPEVLQGAWHAFHAGRIAQAIHLAERVRAGAVAASQGDLARQAKEAQGEFTDRTLERLDRVEWMMENGAILRAESALAQLRVAVESHGPLEDRVEEVETGMATPKMQRELSAARQLQPLEAEFMRGGGGKALVARLRSVASSFAGTHAARRANYLAEFSRGDAGQ